jgi:hypothetical protein
MSSCELDEDDYTPFVFRRLGKDDEMRFLVATIKLLLFQGFELSQIIAVWNDVEEGKE